MKEFILSATEIAAMEELTVCQTPSGCFQNVCWNHVLRVRVQTDHIDVLIERESSNQLDQCDIVIFALGRIARMWIKFLKIVTLAIHPF